MKYRVFSILMVVVMVASLCVITAAPAGAGPGDAVTLTDVTITPTLTEWTGVNMPMANKTSRYSITFTTSASGALTAGQDEIIITFPDEFQLPESIDADYIYVDGVSCGSAACSGDAWLSASDLHITVPQTVNNSSSCDVVIAQSVGISNPQVSQERATPFPPAYVAFGLAAFFKIHQDNAPDELYELQVTTSSDMGIARKVVEIFDWVSIDPTEFPAKAMVEITGAGFTPGSSLSMNGTTGGPLVGLGIVEDDGTFTILGFSSGAPPFVPFEVVDGSGRVSNWLFPKYSMIADTMLMGGFVPEVVFHVLPSLQISPNEGPGGSLITLTGSNWGGTPTAVYPKDMTIGGIPLQVEGIPVMKDLDHDAAVLAAKVGPIDMFVKFGLADDFQVNAVIPRMIQSGKHEIAVTGGDQLRLVSVATASATAGPWTETSFNSMNCMATGFVGAPLNLWCPCPDGGTATAKATFTIPPRTVTATPGDGAPGSTVTLTGEGFPPGEPFNYESAGVDYDGNGFTSFQHNLGGIAVFKYGNTTKTGTVAIHIEVDDGGNFSVLGTIPEDVTPGDGGAIIVFFDPTDTSYDGQNDPEGDELAVTATFVTGNRELTVIPDNGPYGTSIMISGGGFGSGIDDGNTGPDLYINDTKDNDTNLANLSSSGDVIPKIIKVDADLNAANDGLGFNYGANTVEVRAEDNGGRTLRASATFEITRPTLVLDMEQGPRGTLVTVEGDGWLPGDINFVTIKYTTVTEPTEQTIAVKNPDGAGHIWAQFKVPPFEMGGDEVNMQIWGTEGDNTSLKANFLVTTPTISVDPESAAAGEKVMVTGTGFQPLTQLQKLTIAGAYVSRIDTLPLTDAKGYFEVEGTVPGVMPGGQAVLALVTEGNPITCPFTVMAGAGGDISVEDGFATIDGKYTRVWTFDKKTKEWLVYDVDEGAPDQFGTLNRGQGYWVNVTEDCSIVYGAHTYDLVTGWNLIGWQD